MSNKNEAALHTIAKWMFNAKKVVVFTGAGISTESGIPDFRSPGGVWQKYQPVYFQDFLASADARARYWLQKKEGYPQMAAAKPNATHFAIAEMFRLGRLSSIITQNIDGLHHDSGVPAEIIIELHGTERRVTCLSCNKSWPREEIQQWLESGIDIPECDECGGYLKPATISFGQSMPEDETRLAMEHAEEADVFLALGSSLVVYPAAQIPMAAKGAGAKLAIITLSETPQDSDADIKLSMSCGEAMSGIVAHLKTALDKHN